MLTVNQIKIIVALLAIFIVTINVKYYDKLRKIYTTIGNIPKITFLIVAIFAALGISLYNPFNHKGSLTPVEKGLKTVSKTDDLIDLAAISLELLGMSGGSNYHSYGQNPYSHLYNNLLQTDSQSENYNSLQTENYNSQFSDYNYVSEDDESQASNDDDDDEDPIKTHNQVIRHYSKTPNKSQSISNRSASTSKNYNHSNATKYKAIKHKPKKNPQNKLKKNNSDEQLKKFILSHQLNEIKKNDQGGYKTKEGHVKRHVTEATKKLVASRQKWQCGICKRMLDETYEVDHIKPLYKGGTNDPKNLMALDPICHRKKTNADRLGVSIQDYMKGVK